MAAPHYVLCAGNPTADPRWFRTAAGSIGSSGQHPHPAKTRLMLAVLESRLSIAEPRSCMGQAHVIYDVGAGSTRDHYRL